MNTDEYLCPTPSVTSPTGLSYPKTSYSHQQKQNANDNVEDSWCCQYDKTYKVCFASLQIGFSKSFTLLLFFCISLLAEMYDFAKCLFLFWLSDNKAIFEHNVRNYTNTNTNISTISTTCAHTQSHIWLWTWRGRSERKNIVRQWVQANEQVLLIQCCLVQKKKQSVKIWEKVSIFLLN